MIPMQKKMNSMIIAGVIWVHDWEGIQLLNTFHHFLTKFAEDRNYFSVTDHCEKKY
jgi:hypothetical protein